MGNLEFDGFEVEAGTLLLVLFVLNQSEGQYFGQSTRMQAQAF